MENSRLSGFKIVFYAIGIIIQILIVVLIGDLLNRFAVYAFGIMEIVSLIFVIHINYTNRNADYKISWIIFLLAIPALGVYIYFLQSSNLTGRRVLSKYIKEEQYGRNSMPKDDDVRENLKEISTSASNEVKLINNLCKFPCYDNTTTEYFRNGYDMFQRLKEDLMSASKFIFLEYFIVAEGDLWQEILEILTYKARNGVEVRLIVDDIGSLGVIPKNIEKLCRERNIKFSKFNPIGHYVINFFLNNRDHRKIAVIDGKMAYNGGVNIGDEYTNAIVRHGYWKDTAICIKGPGVYSFTVMFLTMWNTINKSHDTNYSIYKYDEFPEVQNGFVMPYDDGPNNRNNPGELIYMDILHNAKQYVYITTPYLILDQQISNTLIMTARKGVDVRIITPYIPDKKIVKLMTVSNYGSLLEAGVKIYEFTPGFIHSKNFVSDDTVATVGSINMDYRSFYLHFECNTWMYKTSAVMDIKKDFMETIEKSTEITYDQWENRNFIIKVIEAVLKVFAPLM